MEHIAHIWPTVRGLADDIGVAYTTAHSWKQRGRIPSEYDFKLIAAAKRLGKPLTLEALAKARMAPPKVLS